VPDSGDLQARRLRFELVELLLVAAGAVPGALLRWQAELRLGPLLGGAPWAQLLVNLTGCLVLGLLAGPIPWRTPLVLCLGIGFCGALTTFSSWMLNLVRLAELDRADEALWLLLASLVLGLLAAAAGAAISHRLMAALRRRRL
jgi:CrcB protein